MTKLRLLYVGGTLASLTLLVLLGGCATTAAVEEARAETAQARADIAQLGEDVSAKVSTLAESLSMAEGVSAEQAEQIEAWDGSVQGLIEQAVGEVDERLATVETSLEPVDLTAIGATLSDVGGMLGGTGGSVLGGAGILATWLGQRRGRRRERDAIVRSVQTGREMVTDPDSGREYHILDMGKVAGAQDLLGIRRKIRDSSMRIDGVIS